MVVKMSAAVIPEQFYYQCHESPAFNPCPPQPRQVLHHTPHQDLLKVTHGVLWVENRPETPEPNENIRVEVLDGSTGTKVPLDLKSTDTIGKLKEAFVKKKPHMQGSMNLVYNGKTVESGNTLCELQVMPGATFITYQKCIGG